jgi:hypothetical protein
MPHVSANQFNLVPDIARLGTGFAQGQQIGQQFQASQRAQAQEGRAVTAEDQRQSELRRGIINELSISLKAIPFEQRPAALEQAGDRLKSFNIDPATFQGADLSDASLDQVTAGTGGAPAVDAPKQTTLERNLIAGGLKPGTEEFQAAILKGVTKPSTQVNIGGEAGSFSKALGTQNAKTFGQVNEQRDTAIEANQSLSVLENIDVNTGALEPAKQALASFGKAFGIDVSGLANVSAGEAFNAEAQRIVLSVKASQKGPQTDKDEATIRKTVASLGNTKEGNQFIIDSARALNNRRIERADFYDNFIQSNDGKFTDPQGKSANSAWAEFKRATPMVSANLRTPEGLPVFFYKFEQDVRQANPDAAQAEILEAWRNADKKRVK